MVTNDKVFNIMMSEAASPMEYSGTLPLDLEEFPVITNDDGTISNIITRQYSVDDKVWLLPSMRKGKHLTDEEIDQMIKKGEHFGIFNNKTEADWMDMQIHEDFEKMYGG